MEVLQHFDHVLVERLMNLMQLSLLLGAQYHTDLMEVIVDLALDILSSLVISQLRLSLINLLQRWLDFLQLQLRVRDAVEE